jgi:hypothetical protein
MRFERSILNRWNLDDKLNDRILSFDNQIDRSKILIQIYEGVYSLFRDKDAESRWIRASIPDLEGQSLLQLISDGSFIKLLQAKDFVDYINGR